MDRNAEIVRAAQALADVMSVHGGNLDVSYVAHWSETFSRWTYDIKVTEVLAEVEGDDFARRQDGAK